MLEQLTELRKTVTYIYQFIIGLINDIDEQPAEQIHGVRSERAPSTMVLSPWRWRCVALLVPGCVHPPGRSLNPILLGFLWRLHHVAMINY